MRYIFMTFKKVNAVNPFDDASDLLVQLAIDA